MPTVAAAARDAGVAGLEFLTGIPGTIGGTLRMNGGAYGREIKDVFVSATAVNRRGDVHKLGAEEIGFSYRHTELADDWIFLGAELKGELGVPDTIAARIREIRAEREDSQPTQARTGGSTFANPPGPQSVGVDRRRRMSRSHAQRGTGFAQAYELPHQHRQRHRHRPGSLG